VRAFGLSASRVTGNALGLSNTGAPAAAGDKWWGCPAGPGAGGCDAVAGAVELGTPRATAPVAPAVPAPTADALPSATFADPLEGTKVAWGETLAPVVVAADDFGVKSVRLSADGVPIATIGHVPYEFTWTPAYGQIGRTVTLAATVTDSAGQTSVATVHVAVPPVSTSASGSVGGTVPATLALTLGPPVAFGAFVPGLATDYSASTIATVISTAGDAVLSVTDPSPTAPGHLVNGGFALPQALQSRARNPVTQGTAYNFVGASPLNLLSYAAPISNDGVTLDFKQAIGAGDALRTGSYSKTLTFTLSTTTP
jgi:Bacterial Ig domain